MSRTIKKPKPRKTRNYLAIHAHNRKAGVIKDKRKKRKKNKDKKELDEQKSDMGSGKAYIGWLF